MILSGVVDKIRKLIFVSLVLLFSRYPLRAQEFGGNPPSLKWQQLNTSIARVIFPEGLDSLALDINAVVSRLAATTSASLGEHQRKINIVLQNQPTYSNGYVALGPFRSEFYLTPRQNSFELGSLPWHKTLALHEYRHVQQFSNFRIGASKWAYYIFGEEGQALANSLAIPDWFWEGDAVYQETIMSRQGRGRLPYFFNGYRSLWGSATHYSWMKLRNGSYKNYVPDHYQLGYLLVNYGYHKYGKQAWKKISSDAAAFKGIFYPFQKSFARNTGQTFRSFRNEALNYYSSAGKSLNDSVSRMAARNRNNVTDQLYPRWISDQEIVFLEATFNRIPAFYKLNTRTGEKVKIRNTAVTASNYFAANAGKIVYSSFVPDPRWSWRNYESVTIVDINTGKEKRITKHQRYLSPSLSQDGSRIVAVNWQTNSMNSLHVLDATTGKIIREIPSKQAIVYTYPVFYSADTILAAVRNKSGEMALGNFNINTGDVRWLTPFKMEAIAFPSVNNDTVFFSRSGKGRDLLCAIINGRVMEFTPSVNNYNTGNYLLSGYAGKYSWSAFTSAGYRIFVGDGKFEADTSSADPVFPMLQPAVVENLVNLKTSPGVPIEKYSAGYHLFNFHSWRPYFSDPEYSYSLVSNNMLNTLQTELFINYNRNENFKETGAQLSYGGFYPVLSGGASYTFDRSFRDTARTIRWNEFNARVGANVPLQFTSGAYSQTLNIGMAFNTKQVFYTGASKQLFDTKKFNYGELSFAFANQQLKARQNIFPRFAQMLSARYRSIINRYTAHQLLLNAAVYLPGIARNHHLVLQASYQRRDTLQQYIFPNSFPVSRGYPDIDFPRMWKAGINYHFPLFYPDAGFANILYLLRVRSNVFYDFGWVKSLRTGRTTQLDAAGAEIYFDTRWWNQLPVSIGVRYSRLLNAGAIRAAPNQWQIVLPVNLLSR